MFLKKKSILYPQNRRQRAAGWKSGRPDHRTHLLGNPPEQHGCCLKKLRLRTRCSTSPFVRRNGKFILRHAWKQQTEKESGRIQLFRRRIKSCMNACRSLKNMRSSLLSVWTVSFSNSGRYLSRISKILASSSGVKFSFDITTLLSCHDTSSLLTATNAYVKPHLRKYLPL